MSVELTKEEQELFYNEITRFYDLAEGIIDAIEKKDSFKPDVQIKIVTPIINQIEESTEVLTNSYITFVENGQKATSDDVKKVETAIRKIFAEILKFTNLLKSMPANG